MTISRRRVLGALPALLAGAALAQPAGRKRPIGVLSLTPRATDPRLAEFERALAALGHIDGKTVDIEWRDSEDRPERLPALVNDLLHNNVEVIVATTTSAVEAARRQTTSVPIVFVSPTDPVGSGFAQSLARPGFNITGVAADVSDIAPQQLELVKQVVPRVRRLAAVLNPRNRIVAQARARYEDAAAKLGIDLVVIQVGSGENLRGSVRAAKSLGAQAIVVQRDGIFFLSRVPLIQELAEQKIPALFSQAENVAAGGLMSYGPDETENYRRCAHYVDRLLKGARAAELPIERPAKMRLDVNLKTAADLGLVLPHPLLARADRVLR
jgi:putative ABC transport system substrate-binding protein